MTLRSVIIMGVSGVGKSKIAQGLSRRLGRPMIEADDHHPESNRQKMASGQPLDDADRMPWLAQLNDLLRHAQHRGEAPVLACSALKRTYRRQLSQGLDPSPLLIHLVAPLPVIRERMRQRDHFMPEQLLQSQFDTLEALHREEPGTTIRADQAFDEVLIQVIRAVEVRA